MVVYHGVPTINVYNSVLKNGLTKSRIGTYGAGIYCSSDYNLAADYSRTSDCFRDGETSFVLPIEIEDEVVKLKYCELAMLCNKEHSDSSVIFNRAKPIPEAEGYCKKKNIRVLMIKYEDTDEVIIYDSSVIKKIG